MNPPPGDRWKFHHGLLLPQEFVEGEDDRLDEIIMTLPCFEPPGFCVEVTTRQLLQHMVLLGSSGSGKTSLLSVMWRELISHRSATGKRCGLLIFDCQGGYAVDHVRQLAFEAGRAEDVVVLSALENHFNPLGNLDSFASIEQAAAKIISATRFGSDTSSDHAYWTENTHNLILAGLLLPFVTNREATLLGALQTIAHVFVNPEWSLETKDQIKEFEQIVSASDPQLSVGVRAMLEMARTTLKGWSQFDLRTKSVLRSCISITISPFLNASSIRYWDSTKGSPVEPADALEGKIVIVSCSAATEPETTGLLAKLIKIEFYGAAQKRRSLGSHHVAGMIMDEFHYALTTGQTRYSDISSLATLRGKGVFVLCATQGLVQLDLLVGSKSTDALLINFGSVIFLRSQEVGRLYDFAERLLGYQVARHIPPHTRDPSGDVLVSLFPLILPREPVCAPGDLAALQPHQAFVSLASGLKTKEPIWFAPLYLPDPDEPGSAPLDSDVAVIRMAEARLKRSRVKATGAYIYYSCKLWEIFINTNARHAKAHQTMTLSEFRVALTSLGRDTDGIASIPPAWRMACFKLASQLPPRIRLAKLAAEDGVLNVLFTSWGSKAALDEIIKLETRWKHSVYPTPLRPFTWRDQKWIEQNYPYLLGELREVIEIDEP